MTQSVPDPALYTAGDQFQREKRTLFARNWLPFAASGQLAAAGDFISHSLGGWPLLAVRGADGLARAFHNVCRHQSMPVVGTPIGHCDELRCPYHGWTYALDGSFQTAPPRYLPADPGSQAGLEPAELHESDGLCLVRVAPSGEPPPAIGFPGRRFAAAVATDIEANWKAVVERLIAEPGFRYFWPLAFRAEDRDGVALLRQVVPRAFLRTRIVDLLFSEDGAAAAAVARRREGAALDKAEAEAWQAHRASGTATAESGAVADFIARVAAACAEPEASLER